MRELIDTRGIKAIKIWPFDGAAKRSKNQYITWDDIDQALVPVKKLRDSFGYEIEIAIEFHGQWNLDFSRSASPTRWSLIGQCGWKTCSCRAIIANITNSPRQLRCR